MAGILSPGRRRDARVSSHGILAVNSSMNNRFVIFNAPLSYRDRKAAFDCLPLMIRYCKREMSSLAVLNARGYHNVLIVLGREQSKVDKTG
jgi:hypothetical protein